MTKHTMELWLLAALGAVWIAELIALIYEAKKKKDLKVLPFICILLYGIILYFFFHDQDGRATGAYAYYVNGVRVSAGAMSLGKRIFLSFFGAAMLHLLAMLISHLVTHGIHIGKWLYGFSAFLIMFGAIMLAVPSVLSKELAGTNIPMIIYIVSSVILVSGIIGMTVYQKYKKKHNMKWP
jgi:hypothetical protein